jgi:RNA polymerase sigma factor (sigma-70 family)
MERVAPAHEPAAIGEAEAPRKRASVLPRSDELLARLVATAGERPFRALYERYHGPLYRYCYSLVRNEADAQDALQSTFTRALVALREGRRNAPLRPWLYRIAHNESISLLRARRPVAPETDQELFAVPGASAEERAAERARLQLLLADLGELAERSRAALVMRELSGLSHEEIAAALGISVGAAKQAIFEARSALFELADGREMACGEVRRKLSDGDRRVLRGRGVRAHLRDCVSCSAFAAAVPARATDLRALVPVLPPAAAAALWGRALEGAASHGSGGALGASAGAAPAAGGSALAGTGGGVGASMSSSAATAFKVLAAIATPKALLATAVVAGVAASATGLATSSSSHRAAPRSHLNAIHTHGPAAVSRTPGSGVNRAATTQSTAPAHPQSGSPSARPHSSPTSGPGRSPGSNPTSNPGQSTQTHAPSSGPPPWAPAVGHRPSSSATSPSTPSHTVPTPTNPHTGTSPGKSSQSTSRTGTPPGQARRCQVQPLPPGLAKRCPR